VSIEGEIGVNKKMANVLFTNISAAFLVLAVIFFKINSAASMQFSNISSIEATNTHEHDDCISIINSMVSDCLPYFIDGNSHPSHSCCFAFESIAANNINCICNDTITNTMEKHNDFLMDVTMAMKFCTICGVSLPCKRKSLINFIPYFVLFYK
jgi:hypothetical protein